MRRGVNELADGSHSLSTQNTVQEHLLQLTQREDRDCVINEKEHLLSSLLTQPDVSKHDITLSYTQTSHMRFILTLLGIHLYSYSAWCFVYCLHIYIKVRGSIQTRCLKLGGETHADKNSSKMLPVVGHISGG